MYKKLLPTEYDSIFENSINIDSEMLLSLNFNSIKKGNYNVGIFHNEKLLIKFFKTEKYNKNVAYIDYKLLKKLNKLDIEAPKLYGYQPNGFMVAEYIHGTTVSEIKDLNYNLLKNLIDQLLLLQYQIFISTNYIVCDLTSGNIIYNGKFTVIDYSCVAIFSSANYARKYAVFEVKNLLEKLLLDNRIDEAIHKECNDYITRLHANGYFRKWVNHSSDKHR